MKPIQGFRRAALGLSGAALIALPTNLGQAKQPRRQQPVVTPKVEQIELSQQKCPRECRSIGRSEVQILMGQEGARSVLSKLDEMCKLNGGIQFQSFSQARIEGKKLVAYDSSATCSTKQ